jgi:hypothetical protein
VILFRDKKYWALNFNAIDHAGDKIPSSPVFYLFIHLGKFLDDSGLEKDIEGSSLPHTFPIHYHRMIG